MTLNITRNTCRAAAAALTCLLVSAMLSPMLSTASAREIEDYAAYEPQTRCSAAVRPGTDFLLDWLVRKYPNTRSSSTLRPCSGGGTSEHKDGRALDWGVDVNHPAQRANAERFLAKIFATDAAGNAHAKARRMGIMYLIWNDHIWSSYRQFEKRDYLSSGCRTRKNCSKTLRHRDHVHISLSHQGAAARTSFYARRDVPTAPEKRR